MWLVAWMANDIQVLLLHVCAGSLLLCSQLVYCWMVAVFCRLRHRAQMICTAIILPVNFAFFTPLCIAVCPQQLGIRQWNHHISTLNFVVAWLSGLCCRVLHWFIVESSGSVTPRDENSHPSSDALAMRRIAKLYTPKLCIVEQHNQAYSSFNQCEIRSSVSVSEHQRRASTDVIYRQVSVIRRRVGSSVRLCVGLELGPSFQCEVECESCGGFEEVPLALQR